MKVLITGTAGFIGYHLALRLLERGDEVVGLDSINDYYDPDLKKNRLRQLGIEDAGRQEGPVQSTRYSNHRFIQMNLEDSKA
ncbi:MAG TPA: NAD-dependent epimerase/dehydratase family protein, partial [Bacteroidales bacterium]|nr:NAD-dependent epimerase/dehydratase family protein [Bacteroidales bacterium]